MVWVRILVVVFAVVGLVAGVMCADLFAQYLGLPYGPAQAAGIGVGSGCGGRDASIRALARTR
ncbi:MAG: hypothetical protein R3C16_13490 [Hyphomonadaceae bacterium]